MRLLLQTLLLAVITAPAFAMPIVAADSTEIFLDSLEASFNYQTGEIKLDNSVGTLKVPQGFRYLDARQSQFVLHDLWGNPEDNSVLGMIVPENMAVTGDAWAFIITYDEMGYVDDDDAGEIDYDEMLTEIQGEEKDVNEARAKEGYASIHMVGWAAKPYYDADKKVLHWAKELQFEGSEEHTLNYNVRILGRKGVLVMNAVAGMNQLPDVQANIDAVLSSFTYSDGNKYSDFNPSIDKVAAWTIGGLVAGKVLAKVGIFALILKNIKLIGLAIAGAFAAVWRWIKSKTEPPAVRTFGNENDANNNPPA